MNPDPISALVVFVVSVALGDRDDRYTKILRTFTNRAHAHLYCQRRNADIQHIEGMCDAIAKLVLVWEKEHPAPDTYGDEYSVWTDQRYQEQTRLETVVGIDDAYTALGLGDRYMVEHASFSYTETKLDGDYWQD